MFRYTTYLNPKVERGVIFFSRPPSFAAAEDDLVSSLMIVIY